MERERKTTLLFFIATFSAGILVWILDAALDHFVFYRDRSFLDFLLLDIPRHEIYIRSTIILFFLAFGFIISRIWIAREASLLESAYHQHVTRLLIDHSPVGVIVLSPDLRILQVNDAITRMVGWSAKELVGRQPPFPWESPERPASSALARLPEGDKNTGTRFLAFETRSGDPLHVQLDMLHIHRSPSEPILVEYWTDLTEHVEQEVRQRELEAQLAQSQRLEMIGRLSSGIAHDFNNLLTGIIGNAELAQVDASPESELSFSLNEILTTSERAASLVRQLLAFSRRQIVQPEAFDAREQLEGMKNMLKRLLGETIELEMYFGEGEMPLFMDPTQLEQIVMNLAVNARDAMPGGGQLEIEAKPVSLTESYADAHADIDPGDYVLVAVSDSGSGMDEHVRAHLFDPFFTTKPKGKGTGLGLSTVYGIVRQNEGAVTVYTEPGHGSTFKVYLPLNRDAVSAPLARESDLEPFGTESILVVEDDENVRSSTHRALTRFGYRVTTAKTGEEAVDLLKSDPDEFDLILTDVVLPGLGGVELAKQAGDLRPDLPVLYASGYTENAIVHHGVLDAGIRFIHKPFSPLELAQKIRSTFEEEQG